MVLARKSAPTGAEIPQPLPQSRGEASCSGYPPLRGHFDFQFFVAALHLQYGGAAGLDGGGGLEQIHQCVGPAAVQREQPVPALQARLVGWAVFQHLLDRYARGLVRLTLVDSETPLGGRHQDLDRVRIVVRAISVAISDCMMSAGLYPFGVNVISFAW